MDNLAPIAITLGIVGIACLVNQWHTIRERIGRKVARSEAIIETWRKCVECGRIEYSAIPYCFDIAHIGAVDMLPVSPAELHSDIIPEHFKRCDTCGMYDYTDETHCSDPECVNHGKLYKIQEIQRVRLYALLNEREMLALPTGKRTDLAVMSLQLEEITRKAWSIEAVLNFYKMSEEEKDRLFSFMDGLSKTTIERWEPEFAIRLFRVAEKVVSEAMQG